MNTVLINADAVKGVAKSRHPSRHTILSPLFLQPSSTSPLRLEALRANQAVSYHNETEMFGKTTDRVVVGDSCTFVHLSKSSTAVPKAHGI